MDRPNKKTERILKGVAIGLLCLFLVLCGFLFLKMGQENDSMEQNPHAEDTYTPSSETEEETVASEDTVPNVDDTDSDAEKAETEPKETTAKEDSADNSQGQTGTGNAGGNKPSAPEEDQDVSDATRPSAPEQDKEDKPAPTEPKPTEPEATEPKPTEPEPTEPEATEPEPTEPEKNIIQVLGQVTAENNVVTQQATFGEDGVSASVPAGVVVNEGTTELVLTIEEKDSTDSGITPEAGHSLQPLDVHIEGVSPENTAPITVCLGKVLPNGMNIGNVTLYHVENGTANPMTQVLTMSDLDAHNEFYYDPATGDTTVMMASFSEIAVVSETATPWKGEYDYSWYDKDATEYTIANADQLAAFGRIVSGYEVPEDVELPTEEGYRYDGFTGKTVKLVADVNLADKESENNADLIFYPIGYYYDADQNDDGNTKDPYSTVYSFEGTFDGQGHTIANFYQNTWEMKGDDPYYDLSANHYYNDAMGLFGYVVGGTVENLTVDNFSSDGEFTPTGVIAAYAVNSTFNNIAITNCNPRVYNTGNGGIVGIGGNSSDTDAYKLTLSNITVDNTNKISALWGSWDVACGGLMGMFRGNGLVEFTNCHVAAQIDVYNDVCANYQYYWYRYSGMMIGSIRKNVTVGGYTYPDMTGISASGCTVHFGEWNDYYYCELVANSLASYTHDHQFSRLTEVKEINGTTITYLDGTTDTVPASGRYNYVVVNREAVTDEGTDRATCYHFADGVQYSHEDYNGDGTDDYETVNGESVLVEDKQHIYLPFNQLFTGYGWGVASKGLIDYDPSQIKILDRETADSVTKFEKATTAQDSYTTGKTVTIGELFAATEAGLSKETLIDEGNVKVFVSPVGTDSSAAGTYTANTTDWTQGTIQFSGLGAATISITDYNYCKTTTINVTIVAPTAVDKFAKTEITSVTAGEAIPLSTLFTAVSGAEIDDANVTVTVTGVEHTYAPNTTDWAQGTVSFNAKADSVTVTINDNNLCNDASITINVVENESFTTVLPTASYLYRVGNVNTVALGKLFKATDGATINGTVEVSAVSLLDNETVVATASADKGSWTTKTMQFDPSFTGPVAVTINALGADPYTLNLEVVKASNVVANDSGVISGWASSSNNVLLEDVDIASNGTLSVSGCTLYGNGFEIDATNAAYSGTGSVSNNYVVYLSNGILDNVQIVGAVYTAYGATVKDNYNRPVVLSVGNNTITNCYISNCAAPVRVRDGNLEIVNSTLKGGNFANLDIRNGHVILDNVTTINQVNGNDTATNGTVVVGLGVVVYYENVLSTTTVEVKNGIKQYNYLSESQANTYITDATAKQLVSKMFDSAYSAVQYNDGSEVWVNTGILSMTETVGDDNISDVDGYNEVNPSITGVTGYLHAKQPDAASIAATAPAYVTSGQGAIAPSYIFDYTTKNYVAKTAGSNDYCYEENGTVLISMDEGESFSWDTSILSATKNGQTLAYTVSMNDTDYTGKSITFNTAGDYAVTYTYTDTNNYGVDANGDIAEYSKTYTKTVHISVSVIKPDAKYAEFTFGSSNTASKIVTVGNNTYVMPDVTATSSTIGSTTVDGTTIYYPIVEIVMSDSKTSHTSAWYAYFPVLSNAVTITDYADGGTGDAVTYGADYTDMPSGLSVNGDPSTLFKYQSSSSAGTDPVVKNNILVYSSPSISKARNEYNTVVTYIYKDNAGATYYYCIGYHAPAQTYSPCVTPDTLVMLADRTQKRIDQVTYTDQLLVWNFHTGEYDIAPASIIMNHGYNQYSIVTLNFDDGTVVNTINGHGFFDQDINKYVILNESNAADYVGHSFIKQDGDGYSATKLIGYSVTEEHTESWSILTAKHYNAILEGMFTLTPAEVEGSPDYLMPFEIGEGLKYDEAKMQADIEQYGLYTYEDFAEYMTYEQFTALDLAIFKVSVAKGYITWDEIMALIEIHIPQ